MEFSRNIKRQLMFAILILSGFFIASCNGPVVDPLNTPFNCELKPYTIGVFATGSLEAGDCVVGENSTTLVDYYEFTLNEVDTIFISLSEGDLNLFKRDGSLIGGNNDGRFSINLPAGTYVLGVVKAGAILNYRTAITTTKVGFGGCPLVINYNLGASLSGDLNAVDCFAQSGRGTLIDY